MTINHELLNFTRYVEDSARGFTGREWIFKAIDTWLADTDGTRTFLILGEPGSGKTALAARLVEFAAAKAIAPDVCPHLASGFISALHFCREQEHRWIDPVVFAKSLSLQLASRFPSFSNALLARNTDRITIEAKQQIGAIAPGSQATNVLINNLHIDDSNPIDAFNRLVREPLEAMLVDSSTSVIILVDSLDEALNYGGKSSIFELLTNMETLPLTVRFILTALPLEQITGRVTSPLATIHNLTSGYGLAHSLDDIESFVLSRFSNTPELTRRLDPDLSVEVVARVIRDKSQGNFLYARHAIDMLVALEQQINKATLAAFPMGLAAIYRDLLERLVGGDPNVWLGRFAPALGVLSIAYEPLTAEQIAAVTKKNDEKFVDWTEQVTWTLRTLRPYLDVDETLPPSQRTYFVYHRSFTDFLTDRDKSQDFWCNPRTQHRRFIAHYRGAGWEQADWDACDNYGLRYLVSHIQSYVQLEQDAAEQTIQAEALYTLVLNPAFRGKQRQRFYANEVRMREETDVQALLSLAGQAGLAFLSTGITKTSTIVGTAQIIHQTRVRVDEQGIAAAAATVITLARATTLDVTQHDLQIAFALALDRGDWGPALACIIAANDGGQNEDPMRQLFEMVDAGNLATAQRLSATQSLPTAMQQRWSAVLFLYLAWEAAQKGHTRVVDRCMHDAGAAQPAVNDTLCMLLAIRAGEALAVTSSDSFDMNAWLHRWPWQRAAELRPQIEQLLSRNTNPSPELRERLKESEHIIASRFNVDDAAILDLHPTAAVNLWESMLPTLIEDAIAKSGTLERLLQTIMIEPLLIYREIACVVLAIAHTFVPDEAYFRQGIRRILSIIFEDVPPVFEFELPALLLLEMQQRELPAAVLSDYVHRASESNDVWGTAFRMRLAQASARFLHDDWAGARHALVDTLQVSPGCPYYACIHLLAFANRWHELDQPPLIAASSTDIAQATLIGAAMDNAHRCADRLERTARVALVEAWQAWFAADEPDLAQVRLAFSRLSVPLETSAYLDFVATQWTRTVNNDAASFKELLLMGMAAKSPATAVFSRLIAPQLHSLNDAEITELAAVCSAHLSPLPPQITKAEFTPIGDLASIAHSLLFLGITAEAKSDFERAKRLYRHAHDTFVKLKDQGGKAHTLRHLAALAGKQAHYDEASMLYHQSGQNQSGADADGQKARDLFELAESAWGWRNYPVAEQFYGQALAATQLPRLVAVIQNRLGLTLHAQKRFEEAEKHYTDSLTAFEAVQDQAGILLSYLNLGVIAAEQGHWEPAANNYNRGITAMAQKQQAYGIVLTSEYLLLIGWIFTNQRRQAEAQNVITQAHELRRLTQRHRGNHFTRLDGSKVVVSMMSTSGNFRYSDGTGFHAVELPSSNNRLSMIIIMPDPGRFYEITQTLASSYEKIVDSLSTRQVNLTLPKFDINSKIDGANPGANVSDSLQKRIAEIGLQAVFDGTIPNMAALIGSMRISVEMDVRGISSTPLRGETPDPLSAISMQICEGILQLVPLELRIDRPFLFFIRESSMGLILFNGIVTDPS